ncbi:MAG: hypothetical protein JNJ54_11070 [Myxococcaceae bacterium]|nr:hypothetical protein [Myxococcaceae bacterium]
MTIVCLALFLSAVPVKVAAPGIQGVNVSPELQGFVNEHLAQQLSFEGLLVTTSAQVGATLGLERQKQLLGCADSSCLAEIASALGVDVLLTGSLARLGEELQLDAKLVDAKDAATVAVFSKQVDAESLLLPAMTEAARALAAQLSQRRGITLTPLPRAPSATVRTERRATTARKVGIGLMIGGGALSVLSFVTLGAVLPDNPPPGRVNTPFEDALIVGVLGGLVVVLGGLVAFLAGGTEEVPVSSAALSPAPGPFSFALR